MNYKSNKNGKGQPIRRPAKKQAVSEIDPDRLIQQASVETSKTVFNASWIYEDLRVDSVLKENILKKGYTEPTEIQDRTIAAVLEGKNVMGIANTGTGKTAAFLIPIIEQLQQNNSTKGLVLVPTRELALQVEEEFLSLSKGYKLQSACFIGGTNIERDFGKARQNNRLIIATPGRLLDLIERRSLSLKTFEILVLDEFDRMLDMGFVHDVKRLVRMIESRRQTLLFSATNDSSLEKHVNELISQPLIVQVSSGKSSSETVNQNIIRVEEGQDKFNLLVDLMADKSFEKVILFAETKRLADRVSKRLNKEGITADQIHGDKTQNYRVKALSKFKEGKIRVLVATDVAARGIDVSDVSHVINYQLPRTYDSYIHRIGRTGRAGKTGEAYTFIDKM